MTKNGTPLTPIARASRDVRLDLGGVRVRREHAPGLGLGDADLGRQPDERVRVIEDLALDELRAQEPLVDRQPQAERLRQVGDPVGVERVHRDVRLEVVVKALGRGERHDPLVELLDLGRRRAELARQVRVVRLAGPDRVVGLSWKLRHVTSTVSAASNRASAASNRRFPM